MGVIEDAHEKSFKESLRFVIDAASNYVATNPYNDIPSEGMTVMDEKILMQKGKFVTGIILYKNDEIELDFVSNGQYCGAGTKENMVVVMVVVQPIYFGQKLIVNVAAINENRYIASHINGNDPSIHFSEIYLIKN